MLFICYSKCTTCQKAVLWLDNKNISYTARDIKTDKPSYEELKEWLALSGLPIHRFINTSGLLYKSMGLKDKLHGISQDDILKLLATDGMLVKRPIIVSGNIVLVGFDEAKWSSLLL